MRGTCLADSEQDRGPDGAAILFAETDYFT